MRRFFSKSENCICLMQRFITVMLIDVKIYQTKSPVYFFILKSDPKLANLSKHIIEEQVDVQPVFYVNIDIQGQ